MPFETPVYPGIDLDSDEGPHMYTVAVAFIVLSLAFLVLRLISRAVTQVPAGMDDWLIAVAAIFSWGYTATVMIEIEQNHYGQHIHKSDEHHLQEFEKGLYALAIVYPIALTFSKLSLLALYWRIFRVTTARRPLQIVAALNVGWMLAAVFVGIFSCIPVQGFWDQTINSRCIEYPVFFTSNEAFTIALDLVVLLMPVYFIAHLQRSISQRISISSTFLLGLVVTLVSALRLWQLVLAQRKPGFDPTFNDGPAALWAIVEINLWIVVATIPALRPLVSRAFRHIRDRSSTSRAQTYCYRKNSLSGFMARLWPPKGHASNPPDGHLPFDGVESAVAGLCPEGPTYDVQISAQTTKTSAWTPLARSVGIGDDVELKNWDSIRVDQEVELSRPPNAHRK